MAYSKNKTQRFPGLTGKITLRSVFSKEQKVIVDPLWDSQRQWYKGMDRLSDDQKKKMDFFADENSTAVLQNGKSFDLDDKVGKMQWDWIQWCPVIAEDFAACQKSPRALFYIDNEEREAQKDLSEAETILKAMNYIQTDKPSNYKTRVRLLGLNMDEDPELTIKNYLMKMAQKFDSAHKIIDVYENNELGVQLLFLQARDKNIIQQKNGAFLFGQTVLGISEDSVLEYLKDPANRSVVDQISKETNPEQYKNE